MRERLNEFPDIHERAFIGTFHSFCTEVLASRGAAVGVETLPNIFESFQDRAQVLLDAARADPTLAAMVLGLDQTERSKLIQRWLEAITAAKSQLLSPEEVEDETVGRAYEAYDQGLRSCGALDFDDLLLLTYRLFTERPRVADFYRRQYRYISIDEAQDMNPAQFHVLRALCGENYRNVMMVGDPRQAIFAWNGADVRFLQEFVRVFEATEQYLTENFRSCAAVVTAAQALAPSYAVEGQLPINGAVTLLSGRDEADEAHQVCTVLDEILRNGHRDIEGPVTLSRCAVIGRTRFAMGAIEDRVKVLGWEYFKQLSSQHESESDVVRDFEVALRVLSNPRDQLHLRWLVNRWSPKRPATPETVTAEDVKTSLARLASTVEHKAVLNALQRVGSPTAMQLGPALDALTEYANLLRSDDDKALVLQDVGVWREHWDAYLRRSHGGNHSLGAFLGDVALGATQQHQAGGLALLTVHSAKGLEFDVVAVVGMANGVFPDYRARGQALEEEKRNAFVAVTRAKRILLLSYPASRMMPWGDSRTQQPSPFFEAIRTAITRQQGVENLEL